MNHGEPTTANRLQPGEVHVHGFPLDAAPRVLEAFLQTLDDIERKRAARFQAESTRQRFIAAHGQMRHLLAAYLNSSPGEVRFRLGPQGKPCLASGSLRFNLSHSEGVGLLAVALEQEVGVDLEQVRPFPNFQDIARRWFSPQEVAALFALTDEQRLDAFFACWTRKESYLKAVGTGISTRMGDCAVSLAPGDPARLLQAIDENMNWSMRDLDQVLGHRAALTVEGNVSDVSFRWHEGG